MGGMSIQHQLTTGTTLPGLIQIYTVRVSFLVLIQEVLVPEQGGPLRTLTIILREEAMDKVEPAGTKATSEVVFMVLFLRVTA